MATLKEAIASGRPFKFKSWSSWYLYNYVQDCLSCVDGDGSVSSLHVNQALSDKWEIKPAEPRKWEYQATTFPGGLSFKENSPPEWRDQIKVKVTIEEIIEQKERRWKMGCDIHAYMEIKINNKWESNGPVVIQRRYGVFGAMTDGQVRGDGAGLGFKLKGLPEDVTERTKASSDEWDSDGHSHSYLTSEELMKLRSKFEEWGAQEANSLYKEDEDWFVDEFGFADRHFPLMEWIEERNPDSDPGYWTCPYIQDVRLVFWFDN